jgi:predicted DsbA family dithiol-disulfide isomerase
MLMEIWSDVVCPWCYIGKRRFEQALRRFEHAEEVEVRWRSYELDPGAPARRPGRMAEHLAAKYHLTIDQASTQLQRLDALAATEGLRYDLARTQGGSTFDAHRLIHLGYAHDAATGAAVKEAMLRAYFTDLQPIGDPEVLVPVAVCTGLDEGEVRATLASDRFADDVRADERQAAELGCTGVPFFVVDRRLAVPGAQDADTMLAVLRRAWDRAHPVPEVVGGAAPACEGDACAVPSD